jgi:general stress protein 26
MKTDTDPREHLIGIMRDFDTAMLTSHSNGGLHARPMAVAEVRDDGTIVFVTDVVSPKIGEIQADAKVFVLMQGKLKFVALTGYARVVYDKPQIDKLWKESWKTWFPNGKEDPSIRLIEVMPVDSEFWDNSGTEGIKYVFEAAKAYLQGTKPDPDREQHDRIRMS